MSRIFEKTPSAPKIRKWVISGVILLMVWYFPVFLWLGYRLGLSEIRVADIRVNIANTWAPAPSWYCRLVFPSPMASNLTTVILLKVSAFKAPWKQFAYISKSAEYDEVKLTPEKAALQNFSWGKAYLLRPEISRIKDDVFIIVPNYNITILSPDSTILNDIREVNFQATSK